MKTAKFRYPRKGVCPHGLLLSLLEVGEVSYCHLQGSQEVMWLPAALSLPAHSQHQFQASPLALVSDFSKCHPRVNKGLAPTPPPWGSLL